MPTPSLLAAYTLLLAFALLQLSVSAQSSTSASSVDPLNGSTLSLAYFTPSETYTPITTFQRASGGVQTVLTGVGPSNDTGTALFTYTRPTATVAATPLTGLSASLAKSGYPTATDARNLAPSPDNLQIADNAVQTAASMLALLASLAVGALAVFVL
ncbi:hypothetical protein ACQY0O_000563 [Thecaphora frezii]